MKTVLDECCTRLECSARLTVRTARLTARPPRLTARTARTARLPNQGGIMSHHTIQFTRVSHALVDTQFECGLRLPKALRACESIECRTRFERWDLTKGG